MMFEFLKKEGIDAGLLDGVREFRAKHPISKEYEGRIPFPSYNFYGKEIWETSIVSLLNGENLLLVGPKATGKNVLCQGLSNLFGRPEWDISLHINTDAVSLIGEGKMARDHDGWKDVSKGPIVFCAEEGGFGVLDEINMAKNEAMAVLHATLDFRHTIDVPGFDQIRLHPATRFIGTMNYGYAGTRDVNEALASRFMIIRMPIISQPELVKLILTIYPQLKTEYADAFSTIFHDIREQCERGKISTKPLDLRGLLAGIRLMYGGLSPYASMEIGMINKCFDDYERRMVREIILVRLSKAGLYGGPVPASS